MLNIGWIFYIVNYRELFHMVFDWIAINTGQTLSTCLIKSESGRYVGGGGGWGR